MAVNERRRQQKLEKKRAKDQVRKKALVREKMMSHNDRVLDSARGALIDCLMTENESGLSQVLVSRQARQGMIAFIVVLVDHYCLGVKSVKLGLLTRSSYENDVLTKIGKRDPQSATLATVAKLLMEAADYSQQFGIPPHADLPKAMRFLGDVFPEESTEQFEFGKDGKPLFIAGPLDTPERCHAIMTMLRANLGDGGYHYVLSVPGRAPSSIEQ